MPKITRVKGRQTLTKPDGTTIDVDEVVSLDYGKSGVTTVYITPPCDEPIDVVGINNVLARYGYKLAKREPNQISD